MEGQMIVVFETNSIPFYFFEIKDSFIIQHNLILEKETKDD